LLDFLKKSIKAPQNFFLILIILQSCEETITNYFKEVSHDFIATDLNNPHCRFGNQVLQYMYFNAYKIKFDLDFILTPWIGTGFFQSNSKRVFIVPELPEDLPLYDVYSTSKIHEFNHELLDLLLPINKEPILNSKMIVIPIEGIGGLQSFREDILNDVQLDSDVKTILEKIKKDVLGKQKILVAHIRQGDYYEAQKVIQHVYVMPMMTYLPVFSQLIDQFEGARLYLAAEDIDPILSLFESFNPLSYRDFDLSELEKKFPKHSSLFFDYYMMMEADHLMVSNSTLSYSAAMLNQTATTFLRPVFQTKTFRDFQPWNEDPLEKKPNTDDFWVESFEEDVSLFQEVSGQLK
jgi:hypothetical protein